MLPLILEVTSWTLIYTKRFEGFSLYPLFFSVGGLSILEL